MTLLCDPYRRINGAFRGLKEGDCLYSYVGKNKLKKFTELDDFPCVFQKDTRFKGKWNQSFFKNDFPLILELACGKGEYTVNLAQLFPNKNFIGIDIKGNRLWHGARAATEQGLSNVAFLRIQIEHITSFFETKEVSEIWITFPDPQPSLRRERRRLTHPRFLNDYGVILQNQGMVHLKTDSASLTQYTLQIIESQQHVLVAKTEDLYRSNLLDDSLFIKTDYEKKYLEKRKPIHYIKFGLRSS